QDETVNYFLSFFWGGLMIGRLMASISLSDKFSNIKKHLLMGLTSLLVFGLILLITSIRMQYESHQIWIYLFFMLINYLAFIAGQGNPSRLIVIFCTVNTILLLIGILAKGEL